MQAKTAHYWHRRYFDLARHVSLWSKDPNAQVGAVVTDRHRRVVALGFNGFPVGVEDSAERLHDQDRKNSMVVHAEQNAILIAGRSAEKGMLYVFGKPVCSRCAGIVIQAGISTVVAPKPDNAEKSKWCKPGLIALDMFQEAKIKFIPSLEIENDLDENY